MSSQKPITIERLHADEALRVAEFPVAKEKVFLAHAGVCPIPRRVADAVAEYAQRSTLGDQETLVPAFEMEETRAMAAKLIGAKAEEIAFVGPTTQALGMVANGLRFRKGANVLIYHDDYPSNVYPWMALADRGVEVRFMNIRELGRIRATDVLGQIDEDTALVALASAHFVSGWRIDLRAIGDYCRDRNILFCVDGIQTVGAFPVEARHVDFLAADSHKWMLGPCAAGILYVRKEIQDKLAPTILGWNNVRCPNFIAQEEIAFRKDARRYEAGSANLLGLVGLRAAMSLLLEVGVKAIADELLRKRAWLVPALKEQGWLVLEADAPPERCGGITSIHRDDVDMAELHKRLETAGIVTSLRADRKDRQFIRVSPHFYNTDAELRRLLEGLL